jgi:hypothetical protein
VTEIDQQTGGSGATYVVGAADLGGSLTCIVTARSAYGEGSATSSPVTVPIAAMAAATTLTAPPPSCTPALGTVTLAGKAGKNSVKFTDKLSGGGELKPGAYTVTI